MQDCEQLETHVFSGKVEIRNAKILETALDKCVKTSTVGCVTPSLHFRIDVPLRIKSGVIGEITIDANWANLEGESVKAHHSHSFACDNCDWVR